MPAAANSTEEDVAPQFHSALSVSSWGTAHVPSHCSCFCSTSVVMEAIRSAPDCSSRSAAPMVSTTFTSGSGLSILRAERDRYNFRSA